MDSTLTNQQLMVLMTVMLAAGASGLRDMSLATWMTMTIGRGDDARLLFLPDLLKPLPLRVIGERWTAGTSHYRPHMGLNLAGCRPLLCTCGVQPCLLTSAPLPSHRAVHLHSARCRAAWRQAAVWREDRLRGLHTQPRGPAVLPWRAGPPPDQPLHPGRRAAPQPCGHRGVAPHPCVDG